MRVVLDARQVEDTLTGVGRYALNLVRHLALLDRENEYIVLRRTGVAQALVTQDNFRELRVPFHISTWANLVGGSRVINPLRADIYHALHHFLPLGVRARQVIVTLHDLIWVKYSHLAYDSRWLRWSRRRLYGPAIGYTLRRADHIVAISHFTEQEAAAHYDLPAGKMTTIHHGMSVLADAVPYDGPTPFMLSLGHSKPYKNIPRVIRAFHQVTTRHPEVHLIIAGRGDGYPALHQLASRLGVSKVHFLGQLSDSELVGHFKSALFLAFPSLVEGFGLPLVEAMAHGCPVLTSRHSAMAEIVGDAAVLVDPMSVEAIADGMNRLIEEGSLRQALALKGPERASRFTWTECAERTLKLYHEVMS